MKKYCIETYGCEMNKAESAAMESILREKGWISAPACEADLVLLNTCTVRATAETRAWGRIALHASEKRTKHFTLIVSGCMAEQHKNSMKKKVPGIDYVLGTFQKQSFGLIVDQIEAGTEYVVVDENPYYVFSSAHHEPGAFRSFVPIMHGCNNFCSYCIVPYVRGREISRKPSDILAELDSLDSAGVKEITFLGQNVNSYRYESPEEKLDFPGLMKLVSLHLKAKAFPEAPEKRTGIGWIRFISSHPKDLSGQLIDTIASDTLFCRHIHLCVQSGSDNVLKRMNRNYSRNYYLDLVDHMRREIPGLSLSTDILVGFPGETEDDFEGTLDIMKKVRFAYAFMYHFNPREGTPAAGMPDQVPSATKKSRLARVIELQKSITRELMVERLGSVDYALIESRSKRSSAEVLARTARDEMVVFKADAMRVGQFAKVHFIGISGNTFKAEEVYETLP
jgi:tRNA-2-methylthio-N6-dimethylallyladenosine synthase